MDNELLEFAVRDRHRTAVRSFAPVEPLMRKIWEFGWHASKNGLASALTQSAYDEIREMLGNPKAPLLTAPKNG